MAKRYQRGNQKTNNTMAKRYQRGNQKTDNTMAKRKRTNTELQNITH